MLDSEGSTYLEDFLNAVELLPNDMRRDFELLKELDSNSSVNLKELTEAEKTCHKAFTKKKNDGKSLDMNGEKDYIELNNARQRIRQRQQEKVDVSVNMLKTIFFNW